MKLSFIGMSGSGKTYWSKKLAEKGFKHFCCDELIEEKLDRELKAQGFTGGIKDVAKWMGQPFEKQYRKTSEQYLRFEKQIMQEVVAALEDDNNNDNIVIDTTGSVIYLEENILQKVSKLTRVVYLQTPGSVKQEMYQLYLKDPKPVIWGASFYKKDEETNMKALARCYPKLLAFRTKKYEKLAHSSLDYHALRSADFTLDKFMEKLKHDLL